jgi:hypothetical protein
MDLLQKHGHLKHDRRKSQSQKEEAEQQHHKTQQGVPLLPSFFTFPVWRWEDVILIPTCGLEINELLGNFGQSHNDHPDRRSSGAGNMARDIEEFQRFVFLPTGLVLGIC